MWQDTAQVSADIFTQHHRYSGHVTTRGNRLADFLNDPTTEILEMHHVQVSQPTNHQSDPFMCDQLLLRKDAIVLAVPTGNYEAPSRRIYSYVEKQHFLARLTLPGYSLVGTMHMPSRPSHWMLIKDGASPSFVPITDVTIRCSTPAAEPFDAKVAIFRRQIIEAIFVTEPPARQEAVAELKDVRLAELLRQLNDNLSNAADSAEPVACPVSTCAAPQQV